MVVDCDKCRLGFAFGNSKIETAVARSTVRVLAWRIVFLNSELMSYPTLFSPSLSVVLGWVVYLGCKLVESVYLSVSTVTILMQVWPGKK